MNLITVSIASYNNVKYIERCVDSVINQTYNNLEILIVDDGSTDNTVSVLGKYQSDERVRVILKDNGGLSSVRQRALDEATGDYICFIDADDYLVDTYVEKLFSKIQKDGSDVCVCSTRMEKSDGSLIEKATALFSCEESSQPFNTIPENLTKDNALKLSQLHLSDSWNKLYRLSSLRDAKVKFMMPKGYNGSDTLFNQLLSLHGFSYSTIAEVGYIHVIYSSSAVHRKNKNLSKTFEIITKQMIAESQKLAKHKEYLRHISLQWYSYQETIFKDIYEDCEGEILKMIQSMCDMRRTHKMIEKRLHILPCELGNYNSPYNKCFFAIYKYGIFLLPFFLKAVAIIKKNPILSYVCS